MVLALVASPQGMSRSELLSSVYGYAGRGRGGEADANVERQFERDKEQLRHMGVPIETIDPPLNTGDNKLTRYRILKERLQLPSTLRFTADELSLLRLASLAWRDGSLGQESRWAGMKLTSLSAGLDVRNLGISLRLSIPEPAAPVLQRAIDERREVRFGYQMPERDVPLERHVAPLRLHRAEGRWHLIAFDLDRNAPRVFLLSRIASTVRAQTAHYDPALLEHVPATLTELRELAQRLRNRIAIRPGSAAEARLEARGTADIDASGRRILDIGTPDVYAFAAELASYGEEVEAVESAELRDQVRHILCTVRSQHDGAQGSERDGS